MSPDDETHSQDHELVTAGMLTSSSASSGNSSVFLKHDFDRVPETVQDLWYRVVRAVFHDDELEILEHRRGADLVARSTGRTLL
jgi:hypothetical protein